MKKVGFVLLAAVSAFFTGLTLFHLGMLALVRTGAETKVPELEGLDLVAARQVLEQAGFTAVVDREEYSAELDEGEVLEQRPLAGDVLRRGRKVWLTVSLGVRKTTVPRVMGLSYRQAGILLARDGLEVGGVSRVRHAEVSRGSVIAQDPPPGAACAEGSRIDLLVSLGASPEAFVVPDFAGRPLRDVESLLRRHGLAVGDKTVLIDRSVVPSTVLEHEPAPGGRIEVGDRIDLVVSARR